MQLLSRLYKLARPNTRTAARLISLIVLALLTVIGATRTGRLEYGLIDLRFSVTRQFPASALRNAIPPAVLLRITEHTEQRIGTRFGPEWRARYPDLIERLADAGARALVWDAAFVAESEFDDLLMASHPRLPVIAAEQTDRTTIETLAPHFAAIGWMELLTVDGVPRRAFGVPGRPPLGSLAAAAVRGDITSVVTEPRWIDYSRDPLDVAAFDLADLLDASEERLADEARTPLSVFSGRVVFVGLDMEGVDRFRLPDGRQAAGVYAHIASYRTYGADPPIRRTGRWSGAVIAFSVAAVVLFWGTSRVRILRALAPVVLVAATVVAPIVCFAAWRVWLPQGDFVIASIVALGLATGTRRIELARGYRESLGFDPELIERRVREVGFGEAGIEREASVLCADVRGYTQLVGDNDSARVFAVMSRYMREMEEIIGAHGGYINKYIGDEIVAVFGFPRDESAPAARAVAATRAILEKVITLRAEWSLAGLPPIDGIGVGIDCGMVRFMRIGGRRRVQFDIIGSAINGASRLQTLTKDLNSPLLVSAAVAEAQSSFPVEAPPKGGPTAKTGPQPAGGEEGTAVLRFAGEVLVRGQGRRRLFALHAPGISLQYS